MNYQQNKEALNQRLADKVQRELSAFREETLGKSPQEIYDAAYQIVTKTEIAECLSKPDYSPQAARAMMKSPNLLQEIYDEWLSTDDSHMEELSQTITDFKDYMVKTEKILSGRER